MYVACFVCFYQKTAEKLLLKECKPVIVKLVLLT